MSARQKLIEAASQRILLTDGAFGTEIQNYKLDEAAYRGQGGTQQLELFLEPALAWLRRVTRAPPDR